MVEILGDRIRLPNSFNPTTSKREAEGRVETQSLWSPSTKALVCRAKQQQRLGEVLSTSEEINTCMYGAHQEPL